MQYDLEYYEKMLRLNSKTAEEVCKIRWMWLNAIEPKSVLDYGCGVGWFRAYRPEGVEVHSYDILKVPQTGIRLQIYDVVCLWDVLEHIPDFSALEPVFALSKHVALTVPMYKGKLAEIENWKHFKIKEHLHIFTEESLRAMMREYGFNVLVKRGQPEVPPREDVWSYLFKKET